MPSVRSCPRMGCPNKSNGCISCIYMCFSLSVSPSPSPSLYTNCIFGHAHVAVHVIEFLCLQSADVWDRSCLAEVPTVENGLDQMRFSQCHPWDVILGLQDAKCQRNTLVSPFTILTVLGGCCSCSLVMEQFGMTNPNAWWLLIVTSATSMDWHQQPSKINERIDRWR